MTRLFRALIGLSREQVRSLYSVAMLAGIVALCGAGALLIWQAESAALVNVLWFKLLAEVIRYVFALIALFALIVGMTVFGAERFKIKMGDKEFSAQGDAAREVADAADDKATEIEGAAQ